MKIKIFMTLPFPLFSDIAELCNNMMATGVGAFHPVYVASSNLHMETPGASPLHTTYVTSADPHMDTSGASPLCPKDVASSYHDTDTVVQISLQKRRLVGMQMNSWCLCVHTVSTMD